MRDTKSTQRYVILAVFAVLLVASFFLSQLVGINYDVSDYLGEETQTKKALNAINEDFGMTGTLQVMVEGVDEKTALDIKNKLSYVIGILNVSFDAKSDSSYKDNTALYVLLLDGDDYSDAARRTLSTVQELMSADYSEYSVFYGGGVYEKSMLQSTVTREMTLILIVSLALVLIIITLFSESWIEPVILLACSGVAIMINRGTNLLLGEISYITNAVSAILQLALSIDYSISILHAYSRWKKKEPQAHISMKNALCEVIRPILASALTTVAGLTALLFMSFSIGFDIGLVLIKGIAISVLTSLLLLPSLAVVCNPLIEKTAKRKLSLKGGAFSKIAIKSSKIISPLALVIVVLSGVLQSFNTFKFTNSEPQGSAIYEKFGQNQSVIVLYENENGSYDKEHELKAYLEGMKKESSDQLMTSYTSYSTTAGELYDSTKLQEFLSLSQADANMLVTMYNLYKSPDKITLTPREFFEYTDNLFETDTDAMEMVSEETISIINLVEKIGNLLESYNTADEFYNGLREINDDNITTLQIKYMYNLYFTDNGIEEKDRILGKDFVDYMIKSTKTNPVITGIVSTYTKGQLLDMQSVDALYTLGEELTYLELADALNELRNNLKSTNIATAFDKNAISGVYIKHAISQNNELLDSVAAIDMLSFVVLEMNDNCLISAKINDETRTLVSNLHLAAKNAKPLLVGEKYSRILCSLDIEREGEEAFEFIESLSTKVHELFGENSYCAGEIGICYDLKQSFDKDNLAIFVFTLISILIIVTLTFRKILLPVLLVSIIQGAVWINSSISLLSFEPVYFLTHIMTASLLMGSTVDYGILLTNNYVEQRKTLNKKEAIASAISMSVTTVFTSGIIMTLCGFAIGIISTQTAISSIGFLIGRGALVSVIMTILALPSILYFFDRKPNNN